jgi:hypothetical protein
MANQVFEMLWDCEFCGTTALLGKSNRHCPSCGAPQNPDKRYFPPAGKEVPANTTFEGADKECPACKTPSGARANNCRHCGSPMDGSKEVALRADRVDGKSASATPVTAPPKNRRLWLWVGGGALGLATTLCVVTMFWTRESQVTVAGHSWSRTVDVESFGPVSESAWCDAMPSDARGVSRHREQRGTEKIEDGQTCTTKDKDRGDGTFERVETCKTKYREEPVYDDKCNFTVDRWKVARTERADGASLAPEPQWPAVRLARSGNCLGCEREGKRAERYAVKLTRKEGGDDSCEMPQAKWATFSVGKSHKVQVRVVGGGVDCASLAP